MVRALLNQRRCKTLPRAREKTWIASASRCEAIPWHGQHLTPGSTGQISAVTFCAKTCTKAAIKNLLGEPGVNVCFYS
jgi:hypothetical protein